MKNILSFLAGGIGVVFFLGLCNLHKEQLAYIGVEYHFTSGWANGLLVLAFVFRFTLPQTIGTFFGAT